MIAGDLTFPRTVPLRVKQAVQRVLARTFENVRCGLPLDCGADPVRTLRELGIDPQVRRANALRQSLQEALV